jgi:insulysin
MLCLQTPSIIQVLSATAEVLTELLQEPLFKELRTNQQLGYIVFSGLRSVDGVASLVVIVQSSQVTNYFMLLLLVV